jgi:hypothetical protein
MLNGIGFRRGQPEIGLRSDGNLGNNQNQGV